MASGQLGEAQGPFAPGVARVFGRRADRGRTSLVFGTDEVIYWSRGAEDLYGWTAAEALGQVTHSLLRTRFPVSKEAVDEALTAESPKAVAVGTIFLGLSLMVTGPSVAVPGAADLLTPIGGVIG